MESSIQPYEKSASLCILSPLGNYSPIKSEIIIFYLSVGGVREAGCSSKILWQVCPGVCR